MEYFRHNRAITTLIRDKVVQYHHILREGNKFADYLDNYSIEEGNFTFTDYQYLKVRKKKFLNNNKSQVPYLRVSPLNR